jgi:hypothetical protein
VKVRDVANMGEAVAVLLAQPMKAAQSFRIACATKELREQYNLFMDTRKKLVMKYGAANENGDLEVTKKNRTAFQQELEEMVEAEVPTIEFSIRLKDIEGLEPPGGVIAMLADHITESKE